MKIIGDTRWPTKTLFGIYGFFGEYRFLSNFEPARIVLSDGLIYPTSEHAYMAQKTLDMALREEIANQATPGRAKKMGAAVPLREDWAEYRLLAMLEVIRAKFNQNPALRAKLLATKMLYLEETNNWDDRFWGVVDGVGLNLLGKTLMQVRAELQEEPMRNSVGSIAEAYWLD